MWTFSLKVNNWPRLRSPDEHNTRILFSEIIEMGPSPRWKEQTLNKSSHNHFVHSQGDDVDLLIVVRANKI